MRLSILAPSILTPPILTIVAAGMLFATPAFAQDTTAPPPPPTPAPDTSGDRVTIAVGAATLPDYEGADSNTITPGAIVIGKLGGFDFFTLGTQLYVDLIRDGGHPGVSFEFGPVAGVRLDRTNRVDNNQVAALGKIDTAYEVGAFAGVTKTGVITSDYDTLTARVAYLHDVSNSHDSYVITPQLTYTTPLSIRTLVSLGASADYVGKGYGRTYFGVTPAGSLASGLRTYDINDSGFKRVNLSFFALQSLTGDLRHGLGIGAGVLYGKMLGKYKRSPIVSDVGNADQWAGAIGLSYTF